jgi:hypothetical protein
VASEYPVVRRLVVLGLFFCATTAFFYVVLRHPML